MVDSVLVTDAETAGGITVIRSLGKAGWRVVAVSHKRLAPGLASRYVDGRHVVPSFETNSVRATAATIEIARSERVDLVVPVADKSVISLSSQRDSLGDIRLAVADEDALDIARDKHRTQALAESLDIPTPRSEIAEDRAMAETIAEKIGFPVVLKPLRSHDQIAPDRIATRSVSHARNLQELSTHLDSDDLGPFPIQIQEHVDGDGVGVELLVDKGRTIAAFQHRRIRQVPLTGGMSASRIAESPDPLLLAESVRVLEALRWTGLAMVEFRVGPHGHHLLEINGRIWGSIALPVRAGLDFPLEMANLFMGRPTVGPETSKAAFRPGVECRNLELELRWLVGAIAARQPTVLNPSPPRLRQIMAVATGLLDPRNEFDVQSRDDLVPGIIDVAGSTLRTGRASIRRAGERLLRRGS